MHYFKKSSKIDIRQSLTYLIWCNKLFSSYQMNNSDLINISNTLQYEETSVSLCKQKRYLKALSILYPVHKVILVKR